MQYIAQGCLGAESNVMIAQHPTCCLSNAIHAINLSVKLCFLCTSQTKTPTDILFFSSWRMTIEEKDKISAGRYLSSFSWLHEEMTYCQKNPITLILKSNICFIKPNPYLADFCDIQNHPAIVKSCISFQICAARAFVDKTTNWVSGFEYQQNSLTTNMKFQFMDLNPDLKSWQQWIGIDNFIN